jgi:uncharacterized membrane protein YGL010W
MEHVLSGIVGIIAIVVVVWFFIFLPYGMAERRGRSGILWVLVSLVISPFLSIVLLLALGDAKQA